MHKVGLLCSLFNDTIINIHIKLSFHGYRTESLEIIITTVSWCSEWIVSSLGASPQPAAISPTLSSVWSWCLVTDVTDVPLDQSDLFSDPPPHQRTCNREGRPMRRVRRWRRVILHPLWVYSELVQDIPFYERVKGKSATHHSTPS